MEINNICPNCMNEIKEGVDTCSHCGYVRGSVSNNTHALKPFTILQGKYLVGNVIGEGGFGITYIGFDLNLELKIAIKEFYPNGFVTRESDVTSMVTNYTGQNMDQYEKWKTSFVREARSLAKFSNLPGIVGVRDFFTENNTAYIVMEYVEGETLKSFLKKRGGKLNVSETLNMIKPVIMSLGRVHSAGIIHRDISPDNIMIENNGNMVLIDFGAARDFAMGGEKSLSVLLKPGYAPEEQYRSHGEQGPWSDVYAICGTVYRCITGNVPIESMERMRSDLLAKPSDLGVSIDKGTEAALMKGLAVFAENRYRNMEELYRGLFNGEYDPSTEGRKENTMSQPIPSRDMTGTTGGFTSGQMPVNRTDNGGINKKIIIAAVIGAGLVILILLLTMAMAINKLSGMKAESSVAGVTEDTEKDVEEHDKDDVQTKSGKHETESDEGDDEHDSGADAIDESELEDLDSDAGEDYEGGLSGKAYTAKFKCRGAAGVNTSKGEKGDLIKGARVTVREGAATRRGNVVGRAVSDKDGRVELPLSEGIYTIEIEYNGYAPGYFTWYMYPGNMEKSRSFYLCPRLNDNEMAVVMTWWDEDSSKGQREVDLDLNILDKSGNEAAYVENNDSRCESVLIRPDDGGSTSTIVVRDMTHWGDNYSDAMAMSDVHVFIYGFKGLLKEYIYPYDGQGTEWEVAEIIDESKIRRINRY